MSYGIDPFLYRTYSDDIKVDHLKNIHKNKTDGNVNTRKFGAELMEKLNNEQSFSLSTNIISDKPDRETILKHIGKNEDRKKLFDAALQFESFFMEKMYKEMKKNVPKNPMFHGGYAEDLFDDMLLTERVQTMSRTSESGLAEMIYKSMQNI